jgi:hypothetical protein
MSDPNPKIQCVDGGSAIVKVTYSSLETEGDEPRVGCLKKADLSVRLSQEWRIISILQYILLTSLLVVNRTVVNSSKV